MYDLDVNFLKERQVNGTLPVEGDDPSAGEAAPLGPASQLPFFLGLAVAVAIPAAVGAYWALTARQVAQIETDVAALQQELAARNASAASLEEARAELARAEEEAAALAGIFTGIKPSTAILQDISDRVPSNVLVNSVSQSDDGGTVTIQGFAIDYEAVNYFLLTLKDSEFLDSEQSRVSGSQQAPYPAELLETPAGVVPEEVVSYTIETQLSDTSADELLPQLEDKGADGLVTRIRELERNNLI